MTRAALVIGFRVTGQAAAAALVGDGYAVSAVDDGEPKADATRVAASFGTDLVWGPSRGQLAAMAEAADLVVLSPGIAPSHPIFSVAEADKIVSEIELAASLTDVPVLAVTGTNGKTTVTSLVAEMLRADGVKAEAVGNIGRPFIEAVHADGAETYVLEVSSFQLAWTRSFRPKVACWLNLAEDHLDWHADMADYAAAKARIFSNQEPSDVAVANADDEVVMAWASRAPAALVTFGAAGDVTERDGWIVTPSERICRVSSLPRSLPHDVWNGCAAVAVALGGGAGIEACAEALERGVPMPHRIELVADVSGVRWYDDSKATTPAAVLAALKGFQSVVLIAGGRNKGLDLGVMVRGLEAEAQEGGPGLRRLRGVVAIGESASQVAGAFEHVGALPIEIATSMAEAVDRAAGMASEGDAVLLSPGCASFDWYRSYGERGDDFARIVRGRSETTESPLEAVQQGGA